jgi:hypothetical protein
MRRILTAMATVGLLVGLAAGPVAAAPGGIDRFQTTTTNYMLLVYFGGNTYTHSVDVTLNPCDSTITMTGVVPTGMTVVGTLANGVITFNATYASDQIWGGQLPGGRWGSELVGGPSPRSRTTATVELARPGPSITLSVAGRSYWYVLAAETTVVAKDRVVQLKHGREEVDLEFLDGPPRTLIVAVLRSVD